MTYAIVVKYKTGATEVIAPFMTRQMAHRFEDVALQKPGTTIEDWHIARVIHPGDWEYIEGPSLT